MTYVLDACSLVAIYKNEQGADKIGALIEEASTGQIIVYINIVNLIEVDYLFDRIYGREKADRILEEVYGMPIHIIDTIDNAIFSETSRLKAKYAIPLGDSIGLATAIKMKGAFVTADHSDFSKIEEAEHIPFFWFR
jgi:predicted nucleic acid-binding protein